MTTTHTPAAVLVPVLRLTSGLADVPVTELRLTDAGHEALAAGAIGHERLFVMPGDHLPFSVADLMAVIAAFSAGKERQGAAWSSRRLLRRARARCRMATEDAAYLVSCAFDRWALGR